MSDEKEIPQPPRAQRDTPVHCSKCGVFNDRADDVCKDCGAHLRLKCKKCGVSNLRTASRCAKCHQLLRAGSTDFSFFKIRFKRRHWRLSRVKRRIERWKGFAILLLLFAAIAVVISKMGGEFEIFYKR